MKESTQYQNNASIFNIKYIQWDLTLVRDFVTRQVICQHQVQWGRILDSVYPFLPSKLWKMAKSKKWWWNNHAEPLLPHTSWIYNNLTLAGGRKKTKACLLLTHKYPIWHTSTHSDTQVPNLTHKYPFWHTSTQYDVRSQYHLENKKQNRLVRLNQTLA
jgi:hypothetical protein